MKGSRKWAVYRCSAFPKGFFSMSGFNREGPPVGVTVWVVSDDQYQSMQDQVHEVLVPVEFRGDIEVASVGKMFAEAGAN
jgi:hypothetical protein